MSFQFLRFKEFEEIPSEILASIILLDQQQFQTPWSKESWSDFLKNTPFDLTVLVNTGTNSVIGFALFSILFEDSFAHLLKILINNESRNQKLGTKLLLESMQNLEELSYQKFFLEVEDSNLAAIKTYQGIGFKVVHKNLNFYGANRHALILTRDLI